MIELRYLVTPVLKFGDRSISAKFDIKPLGLTEWQTAKKAAEEARSIKDAAIGANAILRRCAEVDGKPETYEHRFDANGIHAGFFAGESDSELEQKPATAWEKKKFTEIRESLEGSGFKLVVADKSGKKKDVGEDDTKADDES